MSEQDVEQCLSGLREFANSLREQSNAAIEAVRSLDLRVTALEKLLDPLPVGLDHARLEARVERIERCIEDLEAGAQQAGEVYRDNTTRLDSLERRFEAVVVKMAQSQEFDGD